MFAIVENHGQTKRREVQRRRVGAQRKQQIDNDISDTKWMRMIACTIMVCLCHLGNNNRRKLHKTLIHLRFFGALQKNICSMQIFYTWIRFGSVSALPLRSQLVQMREMVYVAAVILVCVFACIFGVKIKQL